MAEHNLRRHVALTAIRYAEELKKKDKIIEHQEAIIERNTVISIELLCNQTKHKYTLIACDYCEMMGVLGYPDLSQYQLWLCDECCCAYSCKFCLKENGWKEIPIEDGTYEYHCYDCVTPDMEEI